jgi:hypothetical protein
MGMTSLLSQLIGCDEHKATNRLRQDLRRTRSATSARRPAAPPTLAVMWYVGGLAIGIVLVVVLVMAAVKTMRKR